MSNLDSSAIRTRTRGLSVANVVAQEQNRLVTGDTTVFRRSSAALNPNEIVTEAQQIQSMLSSMQSSSSLQMQHQSFGGAVMIEEEGDSSDSDSEGTSGSSTSSDRDLAGKQKAVKLLPQLIRDQDDLIQDLNDEVEAITGDSDMGSLGKLELKEVPRSLVNGAFFPNLTDLSLAENKLSKLPQQLCIACPHLKKLNVTQNELMDLPEGINRLVHLEVLLADHNDLVCLPAMENLVNLVEVGVAWNNLQEFPTQLTTLPRLKKIFLAENEHVQSFPPVQAMQVWGELTLSVDNRPNLLKEYKDCRLQETVPRVTINWNKIYPDKVLHFLYLGSLRTAQCIEVYRDLNIKYVLTAGRHLQVVLAEDMEQLELHVDDIVGANMTPFFESAFTFIERARGDGKGILIHCFAGLSRSVTITVAYLMKTLRLTRDDALRVVRASRPAAHPNEGFLAGLQRYQTELGITDSPTEVLQHLL